MTNNQRLIPTSIDRALLVLFAGAAQGSANIMVKYDPQYGRLTPLSVRLAECDGTGT